MIRKVLFITVVYYTFIAISGCYCLCKDENKQFIYSELETALNICLVSDSSYQYTPLYSDSLAKDALGIMLSLNGTVVFTRPQTKYIPSLVNTANACKCGGTIFSTADTLSSITITTLNNFDSTHTAGADVTAYFKVPDYDYSTGSRKVIQSPIASYLQYANGGYAPGFYTAIYLAQFPQYEGYAQFRIKATLQSGKVLEAVTQKVYLY